MADEREAPDRRAILLLPLAVWAAMLALGAGSLAYALLPGMPAKPEIALLLFAAQAALVAGIFMNLRRGNGLVTMTALIGVVWLGFLFLFSFADLLTR